MLIAFFVYIFLLTKRKGLCNVFFIFVFCTAASMHCFLQLLPFMGDNYMRFHWSDVAFVTEIVFIASRCGGHV